jgi:hypothetical protein
MKYRATIFKILTVVLFFFLKEYNFICCPVCSDLAPRNLKPYWHVTDVQWK